MKICVELPQQRELYFQLFHILSEFLVSLSIHNLVGDRSHCRRHTDGPGTDEFSDEEGFRRGKDKCRDGSANPGSHASTP